MKKLKKPLSLLLTLTMITTTVLFANIFNVSAQGSYGVTEPVVSNATAVCTPNSSYDGDKLTVNYPTEIYMDISETLEGLNYQFTATGHYGSDNKYRAVLCGDIWGGTNDKNSAPTSTGNNMVSIFPNYNVTVENTGTGTLTEDNWAIDGTNQDCYVVENSSNVALKIKMSGSTTKTGDFSYSSMGSDMILVFQHWEYAFPKNQWVTKYTSKTFNSGEVNINVHTYDKAPLNKAITDASTIINNANAIEHKANNYNEFVAIRDNVYNNIMTKRNVTQTQVEQATNQLTSFKFNYPPADYSQLNALIEIANNLDETQYVDFSAVNTAINAVDNTMTCERQYIVDGYYTSLNNAIRNLVYKDADYTNYNMAVAAANALNPTDYVDFSPVANAIKVDVSNKNITQQSIVDQQTTAINTAISNLVFAPADFSALDAELAISNKINVAQYSNNTASVFKEKLLIAQNIDRNLKRDSKQYIATVTQELTTARLALKLKGADYTEVEKYIAQFNALDKTIYTTESVQVVQKAINDVVWDLEVTKQTAVNNMALNIKNSLSKLVAIYASYAEVDKLIATINTMNRNNYVDFSQVDLAVNNVVRNLPADKQLQVNQMATNLRTAINSLVLKKADYTKVNSAILTANSLTQANYTNFDLVTNAVNSVVFDLDITKQNQVDLMAQAINDAIGKLVLKSADYSLLDNEITLSQAVDTTKYTQSSVEIFTTKLNNAISVSRTLKITDQSIVDNAAKELKTARESLISNAANYSVLNQKIAFYEAIDTTPYTNKSLIAFKLAVANAKRLDTNLTVDQQSKIDNAITEMDNTYSALKLLADYSKFDELIKTAENIKNDSSYDDYTTKSKLTFSTALTAAKTVSRDYAVEEQSKITTAINNLQTGINALELKPADLTLLNEEIATSQAINTDEYSSVTVANFLTQLENAVSLSKQTLTIRNQTEVDNALTALKTARESLIRAFKVSFLTQGEGEISVNSGVNLGNSSYEFEPNAEFTAVATAKENYDFMYWVDDGKRIISYSPELTKGVLYSTSYTAVFKEKSDQSMYTVTFLGKNNAILSIQKVAEGEDAVAPVLPYYDGYKSIGWSGSFTCVTSDVTVRANYMPVEVSYTVTASPEIVITGNKLTDGTYEYNKKISFSLNDYSNFKGWSIDGGKSIISYNKIYNVYVGCNMNVTYVTKELNETVNPVPVVAITDITITKDTVAHVAVLTERNAPDNGKYSLMDAGLLFTLTDKELTLESANANTEVFVKSTTSTSPSGQYKLTVNLSKSATLVARGFAVYKNIESGEIITVYSATISQAVTL